MPSDKFWTFIERFKVLIELVIALAIAAPVASVMLRYGLAAVVPIWLMLLTTALAIFLGYLLGRRPRSSSTGGSRARSSTLVQSINFNYKDSPTNHGWVVKESNEEAQPDFKHTSDGFYGNILKIRSKVPYAMDIGVNPAAQIGRAIELVMKAKNDYGVYALVSLQSKDGSRLTDVWLNFRVGDSQPRFRNEEEWEIYVVPKHIEGDWLLFNIDLNEALAGSVGQKGWSFRKLRGFRCRGNLDLAYIKIYQN